MGFIEASNSLAARFADRLEVLNDSARQRLVRHRVYRATLTELNSLTDRELSDLGLRRGMLRKLAREAALRA
jgi:uncharacterized protein YjiS (DUF1127 family)